MTESSSPDSSPSPAARHDLLATSQERRARGKGARAKAPRGTLGWWSEEDRGHDALTTILAQNQIRVPELVPIRHQRMAVSPWNYYRGAAAVMAGDLACQPHSGLGVQFGAAIGQFARSYADQNSRDHAQLVSAIASGAVPSLPA